jgi:hypothetical protein
MSKLVLNGDTSGSVTLDAPAVSGTTTLTLPTTTGTVVVTSGAQTIEFADGSASTPSITNSGDTNTGMFFPAADTIAFAEGGTEQMRLTDTGLLQFNSGYGSVATAYGCRAWVNFNGTANSNLTGTYSQTGTTVTVSITNHGYVTGQSTFLDFTTGTAVDGAYTVTVTDANTFTVTQASRTTSGNVTSIRNTIRGSGNVSSITDLGVGYYQINYTTAIVDSNYCVNVTGSVATSSSTPVPAVATNTAPSTSDVRITFNIAGTGQVDQLYTSVSIFR